MRSWITGWIVFRLHGNLTEGFVAFDKIKSLLQDENGKVSGPRTVIAGFGAGFTESLLAVTPFESIKTQLSVDLENGPLVPCKCLNWQRKRSSASMTENLPILACVASCTVARWSSRKEVFAVSFKVLSRQRQDRLQIRRLDSRPIQHWSNLRKDTSHLERNWVLWAHLPLEV